MYPLYKYYIPQSGESGTFAVKFTGLNEGVIVYSESSGDRPVGYTAEDDGWLSHEKSVWRDPASPKEWLQLLEEPYGSLAVKRFEEQHPRYECNYKSVRSIEDALFSTFSWHDTEEKYGFWEQVRNGLKPEISNKSDHLIFVKESPGLSEICLDFAKKKGILSVTEEGGPFVCFNPQNKTFTCPKEAKNTPVSLSEFIKTLEGLPDVRKEAKIEGFFGWREALIKPDGVVIGCQTISNEKLSEIYEAVSKIMAYEEEIELDGMELFVNSRGVHADGLVISFTEFAQKIKQIQAEQAKLS